jgi:hypothetical protein
VTRTQKLLRWFKSLWLSAWPSWALLVFASLAVVRFLPAGYIRAVVAVPILLTVPGSLTLGALFNRFQRPQGTMFFYFALLLSALWSAFSSLLLYVLGVLITADNTYWCLLTVCIVLAAVAETRLLFGRPGGIHRTAHEPENLAPGLSETSANNTWQPVPTGRAPYYNIVAVILGLGLLCAGLYVYDHHPQPAPAGYTWMAWTGPPMKGTIAIGSDGDELRFQIVHHQSDTTAFQLSAAWLGTRSQPLAKPLTLSIGPNQTFHGTLFIPPLPDGCTYRVVINLTAIHQVDPLTNKLQNWSLNTDVDDPAKPSKTCK